MGRESSPSTILGEPVKNALISSAAWLLALSLLGGCGTSHCDHFGNFTLTGVLFSQDGEYAGIAGYSTFSPEDSCATRYSNTTAAIELATGELIVGRSRTKKPRLTELAELEGAKIAFIGELPNLCENCRLAVESPSGQTELVFSTVRSDLLACGPYDEGICATVFQEGAPLLEMQLRSSSIWIGSEPY